MTEFLPPQARGRWGGILNGAVVTSLPFGASALLIPRAGWRVMFAIGGVGALTVWYMRKAMSESPRWLESIGRYEETEAMLQQIEREVALHHDSLSRLLANTLIYGLSPGFRRSSSSNASASLAPSNIPS